MKCALIPIVVLVPKTSPRPRISRALLRHTLREQIRCVSDGLDPMNVIRDERLNRTIPTNSWNTILSSTEASGLQGEEA